MKLARQPDLAGPVGSFVDLVLERASAYRRNPERLAALVDALATEDLLARGPVIQAIVAGGEDSVAPLVRVLADPDRAAEHATVKRVLVTLGDSAVAPLLGVLESDNTTLKVDAIDVLGSIGSSSAVAPLLAPSVSGPPEIQAAARRALQTIAGHAPSVEEAQRLLVRAVARPLEGSRVIGGASSAVGTVWRWNAERGESMPVEHASGGAELVEAVRLARDLYALDPESVAHRRLYLIALLQEAKLRGGLDMPLATGRGTAHDIAARHGPAMIEQVLVSAMAEGYLPAAIAAAEVLGNIATPAMLAGRGPQTAPLVAAATGTDRRLRYAALEAILKLQPRDPFSGSSEVVDRLTQMLGSYGGPRALIVHPRAESAQTLAALAGTAGFEADAFADARSTYQALRGSPDYDFALIHSAINAPAADDFIAQLRRDPRMAAVPIGIMSPAFDFGRIKRFARLTPRAVPMLEPTNEEEFRVLSSLVLEAGGSPIMPADRHREYAAKALEGLIALTARPRAFGDLSRIEPVVLRAIYIPELGARAATLLGQLGTSDAQRTLLDVVGLRTLPIETRQAAAEAFAASTERFGLVLTRAEILQQYELYNGNAGRDPEAHQLLTLILDAIERRGA